MLAIDVISEAWLLATTEELLEELSLLAKDRDQISIGFIPVRAAPSDHVGVKRALRLSGEIARQIR